MLRKLLPALPFVLVGCIFWACYLAIGLQLSQHGLLHNDVLFRSDSERVVEDLALFNALHHRTNVHPIFVLMFNPVGVTLARFTHSIATAGLIMNSLSGGACIGFAGWFLFALGIPRLRALLFSVILGCSAGHLFFGSSPETYSLSALSIMVLFYLAHRRPGHLGWFVPAGLFSFGILITNLATATIAFGSDLLVAVSRWWRLFLRCALYIVIVVSITAGLALVQKHIWTESNIFFLPQTYTGESKFFRKPDSWEFVREREVAVSCYFFAFDWFAPAIVTRADERTILRVRFISKHLDRISYPGRIALALWAVLLLATTVAFLCFRLYLHPVPLGLLSALLCNFILHSFYGDDLFLYACNTGFLILALIALCTKEFGLTRWAGWAFDAFLLALLGFELANNVPFIKSLLVLRIA